MVTNPSYFIHFIHKNLPCKLGLGQVSYFDGVGVCIISFPQAPTKYYLLSPVFLSRNDDANTLSTRQMKKSSDFSRVTEQVHQSLDFTYKDGSHHSIPFYQHQSLDFVKVLFHAPKTIQFHPSKYKRVGPQQLNRMTNSDKFAPQLLSMYLHLKFSHRPISYLQTMIDHKPPLIILPPGFPTKLPELHAPCPICVIAGATKKPRGPLVDTSELPVGTRLHADFSFYSVRSKRGFIAALTLIDATSRKE